MNHIALQVVVVLVAITAILIIAVLARPEVVRRWEGRGLVFLAFFVLPSLATYSGGRVHLQAAKATSFCLSCHEMEPYGHSLKIDSEEDGHLPALHVQNGFVPRDQACFTCHTEYTMFGDVGSKMRGLRHVWVHYVHGPPETVKLYTPFKNRECLHCHGGGRRFEARKDHAENRADLASNAMSCLECHEYTHDVDALDELEMWEPEAAPAGDAGGGAEENGEDGEGDDD